MKVSKEKAYCLGLLVGGGVISSKTFKITLPFNKWGMNPQNMGAIARDVLTKISVLFQKSYNINISYDIGNKKWFLLPVENANIDEIKNDLKILGLPNSGNLLNCARLTVTKDKLDSIYAESFLSGIFDARASLTKTHRRFNYEAPVVSIEIPGSTKNFKFVVDLCSWLTELGTITDQILYNHPCQHSPANTNYKGWKKGFKIRFLVKSFLAKNSFAMKSKAVDIIKLEKTQIKEQQLPCLDRTPRKSHVVSIHSDIGSLDLPEEVRNKIFFHYHHICAVLGCPFAPKKRIKELVENYNKMILIFPRLLKGPFVEIKKEFKTCQSNYFPKAKVKNTGCLVQKLVSDFKKYNDIESAIAFLFSKKLNGNRHIGPKHDIINPNLTQKVTVYQLHGYSDAPIMLKHQKRAAFLSCTESKENKKVIENIVSLNGLLVIVKEINEGN